MARPSIDGRGFRRAVAALAWSVVLLVGLGASVAAARDDALTPQAIAEFSRKLTDARVIQTDITGRVACFEQQDRTLGAQRDADQIRLGQLVRHKKDLEATLIRQRDEYDGFARNFREASDRLIGLQGDLARLRAFKHAKEQALRECKSKWYIPDFMCDFSLEIAQLTGAIENHDRDIGPAEARVAGAASGMEQAARLYHDSEAALATSEADATTTAGQIKVIEANIGRLQAALASLRSEAHHNKTLLDAFAGALEEAGRVDTADGRARTARTVRTLVADVDGVQQRAVDVLSQTRTSLAPHQLTACLQ